MITKNKLTLKTAFSALLLFLIFPLSYLGEALYAENVKSMIKIFNHANFWLLPLAVGILFYLFLTQLPETKARPYLGITFIVLSVSGEILHFIIKKSSSDILYYPYYPSFPELSVIFTAIICALILYLTYLFIWNNTNTTQIQESKKIHKIIPYICSALYGVFLAFGFESFFALSIKLFAVAKDSALILELVILFAVLLISIVGFVATLIFNVRTFKKTPKTVINIMSEIFLPIFTSVPFILLWNIIYY